MSLKRNRPNSRTGLLVSVRSAREARSALQGGADLIDVKEPQNGPLGAADPAVVRAVVDEVAGRVPVSVALGELGDESEVRPQLVPGASIAKLGLAGWRKREDWRKRWRDAIAAWPDRVTAVGVAYADWEFADAPAPQEIRAAAAAAGLRGVLIDTFQKRQGGLFKCWTEQELGRWVASLRELGMWSAVAGSLDARGIARAVSCSPDWVGVRTAACHGDRFGRVSSLHVAQLQAALCEGANQVAPEFA